jgi:hypothetical protein
MKELNPITTVALIMSCILLLFALYGAYRLVGLWWSRIKANRAIDLYLFCETVKLIEMRMETDFHNNDQEYVKEKIWKLGLDCGHDSAKREQIDVLVRKYSQKYFGK